MSGSWVAAFIALTVVVVILATLVLGLLRRVGTLLDNLEQLVSQSTTGGIRTGLGAGGRIGEFRASTRAGEIVSRRDLVAGETFLIAFLDPGCGYCESIMSELATDPWPPDKLQFTIVINDTAESRARHLERFGVKVLYQSENSVGRAFDTTITPCAFTADKDGFVLGTAIPRGLADLHELVSGSISGTRVTVS